MRRKDVFKKSGALLVIAHAKWRAKRNKRPSMSFRGVLNPLKALRFARNYPLNVVTETMSSVTLVLVENSVESLQESLEIASPTIIQSVVSILEEENLIEIDKSGPPTSKYEMGLGIGIAKMFERAKQQKI
ncbi:hypothetical protein COB55_02235 [Candidatus Wolfebacteria bacterium]|nr:MAG: hypothetical protein COB55_02235 [Candidatus Wolfebacteria bacterium]